MTGIAAGLLAATAPSFAVDADAAQALAKKSNCTKCHAVDKKKEGPPYKETATKYKGKADAEQKLFTHLTTSPKVKVDGKEEEHTMVKSKDEAEIKNLIAYILSQ
jgi:cytochrome c